MYSIGPNIISGDSEYATSDTAGLIIVCAKWYCILRCDYATSWIFASRGETSKTIPFRRR